MSDHDEMDEKFGTFVQQSARGYNEPTRIPREAMWTAIGVARTEARRVRAVRRRFVQVAAGMAAMLIIGVMVGRLWRTPSAPPTVATETMTAEGAAYDLATRRHLTRAEMLLVTYVNPAAGAPADSAFSRWALDLLSTTRLLLDSPAAGEAVRRALLQDLERVLVQLVQKSPAESDAEARLLVERSLTRTNILTRLRTTPAPAAPANLPGGGS